MCRPIEVEPIALDAAIYPGGEQDTLTYVQSR